ncbi:hypothetical protein GFS31_01050 [Leptolyngbya sp. BL0902]|uniref:hypothetical protein n=1 Tax=Leptolyngbya sp. BL0902 TaxID=1115757 RepID=UPI0018E736D9|nr:hypothetical protein [Leptolyngbya sp. BL0902]QQE63440.1 hypothetical protein GFS31_01050 [Leptolyngbya sp. BL0902]
MDSLQQSLDHLALEALFVGSLGWDIIPSSPPGSTVGRPLAQRGSATVILASDRLDRGAAEDSAGLEQRWTALAATATDPLVIALSTDGQRSLWGWRTHASPEATWRFRVVIRGQGDRDWAKRLWRLHQTHQAEFPCLGSALNSADLPAMADRNQGFQQGVHSLTKALVGLGTGVERQRFALTLMLRLVAVAALQQRGYLGGDEWYLHNQFGQSQQRGVDRFFLDVFQPLTIQGLVLPAEDCPLDLRDRLGPLPFIPREPFGATDLDYRWGYRSLPDDAFAPALDWLGDVLSAPATRLEDWLPDILERWVNAQGGAALTTPEPMRWSLGRCTLYPLVLEQALRMSGRAYASVEHLLLALTPSVASDLLDYLGQVSLLDPACGSGRYVRAALQDWLYLAQSLAAIASLDMRTSLPPWVAALGSRTPDRLGLNLYRRFASHGLYGVDCWPEAVAMARLQILLVGVQQTQTIQELASLPDLSLTLCPGNALMGLVTVDADGFDQAVMTGRRGGAGDLSGDDAIPLQGNLLQSLMANTYQAILAERQVRVEHYRSQTELLGESGRVPAYAQSDFLRDRLEALTQAAQAKLTELFWVELSQKLGIRSLHCNSEGRRQSRPLTRSEVVAMAPFHWGFSFDRLLQERGGFDIIVSHFPGGSVQPTEAGFLAAHADLFDAKGVAPSTFLNNHRQVLTIDPDLTQAWATYRGQFAVPSQYFRRSGHYPHSSQPAPGQTQARLYWSRLFLERSFHLLRPGGRCAVVMDPFWAMGNSAPLRYWLEAETTLGGVVDFSNHHHLWPDLPPRTTLSLLWLKKQGRTQGSPYSAYTRAKAPTLDGLATLMQRLIHLAE